MPMPQDGCHCDGLHGVSAQHQGRHTVVRQGVSTNSHHCPSPGSLARPQQ